MFIPKLFHTNFAGIIFLMRLEYVPFTYYESDALTLLLAPLYGFPELAVHTSNSHPKYPPTVKFPRHNLETVMSNHRHISCISPLCNTRLKILHPRKK